MGDRHSFAGSDRPFDKPRLTIPFASPWRRSRSDCAAVSPRSGDAPEEASPPENVSGPIALRWGRSHVREREKRWVS
ncbi:MAG: hypothetical protein GDA43_16850 [Hormoscilla sp. SP5CHS1]|nr:hypothetical protein [Hormoscilla sp. SP5CHS1]